MSKVVPRSSLRPELVARASVPDVFSELQTIGAIHKRLMRMLVVHLLRHVCSLHARLPALDRPRSASQMPCDALHLLCGHGCQRGSPFCTYVRCLIGLASTRTDSTRHLVCIWRLLSGVGPRSGGYVRS